MCLWVCFCPFSVILVVWGGNILIESTQLCFPLRRWEPGLSGFPRPSGNWISSIFPLVFGFVISVRSGVSLLPTWLIHLLA